METGRLLSGQSYSGPRGLGGGWGGRSPGRAAFVSTSLPPALTKAAIEGQAWHLDQAPRLPRLRLALQGLSTLTFPWGLSGLPCALPRDPVGGGVGAGTQRGAGWLARGGSGVGLAVWVSFFWLKETVSFVPRSQGVSLWGWGVAGSPLARRARVGVRAPDSESLARACGQRGHCWGGGRAASAPPLLTKLPAVVEPSRQALGPLSPAPGLPPPRAAKPQRCPSHSGQCPPQPSCARHHCPGLAERRSRASPGTAQETPPLLPSKAVSARGPCPQRCPREGKARQAKQSRGASASGPQMLSLYALSHTPQTLPPPIFQV